MDDKQVARELMKLAKMLKVPQRRRVMAGDAFSDAKGHFDAASSHLEKAMKSISDGLRVLRPTRDTMNIKKAENAVSGLNTVSDTVADLIMDLEEYE